MPAITRILKGCFFRIKGNDFVVHANIAFFRTLNHDLKFKAKKCKENPLRMCVCFSSPLRRSVCVCVWVGWGEGDATLPPRQLITTTYQQEHPFSCTNQQNQKITFNYKFSNCFSVRNILYTKIGFYTYFKKKPKKIKTLFKVYLKLSLWLFNLNFEKEISQ